MFFKIELTRYKNWNILEVVRQDEYEIPIGGV